MTDADLKAKTVSLYDALELLYQRSEAAAESCNSYHIDHVLAQMRGIVWLFKDECPRRITSFEDVLKELSVPYIVKDGMVMYGDDMQESE